MFSIRQLVHTNSSIRQLVHMVLSVRHLVRMIFLIRQLVRIVLVICQRVVFSQCNLHSRWASCTLTASTSPPFRLITNSQPDLSHHRKPREGFPLALLRQVSPSDLFTQAYTYTDQM